MLTRRDALHHLLRFGLLAPADLVGGGVTASEYVGRNHIVRVEIAGRGGFIVKQPVDLAAPDAMTMWTEAAVFWLAANEPAFAPLLPWMPRFHHYDERNALMTIELVPDSDSLMNRLMYGARIDPGMLFDVGRAFAALHGPVSSALRDDRTRRLFRSGLAWALSLGSPQQYYVPRTAAASYALAQIAGRADVLAALERARAQWSDAHIVHGDAKSANVLVLGDGSVRIIDWEIAALGDGLWDIAGLVQSLLIANPLAAAPSLETAERAARPLIDALWNGYCGAMPSADGDGRRVAMLRLAGVRMMQTVLESCVYSDRLHPSVAAMLPLGIELATRPEASHERWERAA